MTLTNDREEFEQWAELACELPWGFLAKRRKDSGEYADSTYEDMWKAWVAGREALANREAQPVAWRHDDGPFAGIAITRAKSVADSWMAKGWTVTPLYTAPPAPAVPPEATPEDIPQEHNINTYSGITWAAAWNACRAAMLAAAPGDENDHDTRR
ncbi:hypothetical protein SM14VA4_04660 [Serratia marcescens]|nr:hypothetical protein SM14VA4_04660 [Serratia marcescens]